MSNVKKDTKSTDGVLVTAAKAIGKAAGTVASSVGVHEPAVPTKKKAKVGKLPPKNKSRLPRKQKKMALKALQAAQA
jgi:cyclic lactone autoinducer peptide